MQYDELFQNRFGSFILQICFGFLQVVMRALVIAHAFYNLELMPPLPDHVTLMTPESQK